MRTKSLILLVLALGCGLVASIGISQVIQAQRQSSGPNVETEQIVVALKEIKPGGKITPDMVELGNWEKSRVPEGAMRSIEQVINYKLPLKAIVVKGEPLLESKFQSEKEAPASSIPKGYVLKAIPADATSAVGNLLHPGDRVNINWSVKGIGNQSNLSLSKTILHNILVFSVNSVWEGSSNQTDKKSEAEGATKFVNLVVTQGQANVLALCQVHGGNLNLTLRPPGTENEAVEDADVSDVNRILAGGAESGSTAKAEEKGLDDTRKSLKGGFLDGIGDILKKGMANLPKNATPAEPADLETFKQTIIEGSNQRIVELYRSKDTNGQWRQREAVGSKPLSSAVNAGTDTSNDSSPIPDKSSSTPNQSTKDIINSLNSGL